MFSTTFKRPLVTLAVIGGLLVAAAPAGAKTASPKDQLSGVHLGVSDGTSNTLTVGEVVARTPAGTAFVVDGPFS